MNILLSVIPLLIIVEYAFSEDVLVKLPNGWIRGRQTETFTGRPFYAFQKIPYAAPPIGNLRFKPPQPIKNWNGILNTTSLDTICYQVSTNSLQESEDCLHLNVYTPELPCDARKVSYPVLLYIFGGGFINGYPLQTQFGPEFLIDQEVIVVTINYRLGPFGFLSTGDEILPGNNGLKDQQFAIKWTHDNIHLFGGDGDKITIVGESSGGASVGYQLLNNKSKGLFRAAILQSGSSLNPWGFQRKPRLFAFKTGSTFNNTFNNNNDSTALLQYLLSVPAADLDKAGEQVNLWSMRPDRQMYQGISYTPVLEVEHEEAFLTEKMYVSIKAGNAIRVPVLMGINSEEAIRDASDLVLLKSKLQSFDENLDWLVADDTQVEDIEQRREIGSRIRKLYCGNGTFAENLGAGIRFTSDNTMTRPVIKHAELQSKFSDVYFYQFSYDGVMGNIFVTIEGADKVCHGEELRYLWRTTIPGYNNSNVNQFPEKDVVTHHRLLKLWTDFVKTLNPTPSKCDLLQNVLWPTVSSNGEDDFVYLDINENLQIKNHPKSAVYKGWVEIYDSLGHENFDTY